jgi:hypothetical protein
LPVLTEDKFELADKLNSTVAFAFSPKILRIKNAYILKEVILLLIMKVKIFIIFTLARVETQVDFLIK